MRIVKIVGQRQFTALGKDKALKDWIIAYQFLSGWLIFCISLLKPKFRMPTAISS